MDTLATQQPGYRGTVSARAPAGFGITVSYWADDAAARAWRDHPDHPDHAAIRDLGRARWYDRYTLEVASVKRNYAWAAA